MSDFLFAVPKALYGIARVVDLGGFFDAYNSSATPQLADRRASAADWQAVLRELASAASVVASEECEQEQEAPA